MSDAVSLAPKRTLWNWLFNPFYFIGGGKALGVGLVAILGASAIGAASSSHFDGAFDFHTGVPAPLWFFLLEGLVSWAALSAFLWMAGILISKSKIRVIDVFGTQALARVPAVVTVLFALLPGYRRQAMRLTTLNLEVIPVDLASFLIVALVGLVMTIWMIVLMYRAFAVSCNARGLKAIAGFIVAAILGEILSKVVLVVVFAKMVG